PRAPIRRAFSAELDELASLPPGHERFHLRLLASGDRGLGRKKAGCDCDELRLRVKLDKVAALIDLVVGQARIEPPGLGHTGRSVRAVVTAVNKRERDGDLVEPLPQRLPL